MSAPEPREPDTTALAALVGERIKYLRAQHSISLTALAAATHLGKGTLSELERGRRNPTLDTLFAIATALAVPLSELLLAETSGSGRELPSGPHTHGQSIDAELIGHWMDATQTVEVYRMSIGAGRRQSRSHTVGVVESITVVSGQILVGAIANPVLLSAGHSHTFPGDQDHFYEGLVPLSSTVLVMRYPRESAQAAMPTTDERTPQ